MPLYITDENGIPKQIAGKTDVRYTLPLGSIFTSIVPLEDSCYHLLDGSTLSGSGTYSKFVAYIASLIDTQPNLFLSSLAEWQQCVSSHGACGKFFYNSATNTLTLPKISGIVEGTNNVSEVGALVEAGLPNITGITGQRFVGYNSAPDADGASSAIYSATQQNGNDGQAGGTGTHSKLGFDASRSNAIYGNSTTVQPQTVKVLYYIVVATSIKTNAEVSIDNIVNDLDTRAYKDLSNCTKPYVTETYLSTDGNAWYRKWSDGWKECGGIYDNGSQVSDMNATIGLPLPFSSLNYNVQGQAYNIQSSAANRAISSDIWNKTLDQIGIGWYYNSGTVNKARYFSYYCCGF